MSTDNKTPSKQLVQSVGKWIEENRYLLTIECSCGEHIERIAFKGWPVKCPKCLNLVVPETNEH